MVNCAQCATDRFCCCVAGVWHGRACGDGPNRNGRPEFCGRYEEQGAALNSNGGGAPDNDGAVGPNNVVQLINGAYAVYDRFGNQEELISGRQFWINAGIDPGNDLNNLVAFNARIVYDPTSGRWIAAELSGQSTNNYVLLARSDTSNPLGPGRR